MAGVGGMTWYGTVDRVPGVCAVTTMFVHLNFLPLVPDASYIVPDDLGSPERFRFAVPVRMSARSVLIGYLRGWLGGFALVTMVLPAVFSIGWLSNGLMKRDSAGVIFVAMAAAVSCIALASLYAVMTAGRGGTVVALLLTSAAMVLYVCAIGVIDLGPRVALPPPSNLEPLPWSVVAHMLVRLTWLGSEASPGRARQLLVRLGYSHEQIEAIVMGEDTPSDR